jgi:hypothetical protein
MIEIPTSPTRVVRAAIKEDQMSRGHQQSYKSECRIRIGSGEIKSLPNDLRTRLSQQKTIGRYPTLWSAAQRAIDLGLMVMEAQQNKAVEIVNKVGFNLNSHEHPECVR